MNPKALPLLLVAAIVVAGSYVRLVDLDRANFNGDELDHYYAARSLQSGAPPLLPSGSAYNRALDYTRMVSFSLRYFEPNELATRLPSTFFGVLSLVLIAVVAWKLGGPWTAVWATGLMAMFPEAIVQSRMTRFYTYQLCWGLVALYAGWNSLQGAGDADDPTAAEWRRAWLWGLITVVAFYLGTRVQLTTFSVAVAWCAAIIFGGAADLVKRGRHAWRRSFPIQASALLVACAAVALLVLPDTVAGMGARSQYVAAWSGPGKTLAYYYTLSSNLPLVVSLLPLIYLVVFIKNTRLALYLGIWFAVPVLLHSWVFPWKGIRYILLALPAMFIATGIAAAAAYGALRRWFRSRLKERGWAAPGAERSSGLIVAMIAVFVLLTTNAFNAARRIPDIPKPINWKAAAAIIDSVSPGPNDRIGSSMGLPALYYWGNVDFVVGTDFLERPHASTGAMEMHPEGSPDWYSGAPTLTKPGSIQQHFHDAGQFIVGVDTDRWLFGNVDPSLRDKMSADAEELCRGRCGDLLLFVWRPEQVNSVADDEGLTRVQGGIAAPSSPLAQSR